MSENLSSRKMPSYRANWAPVFLEPISGSGERITIGVVLRDSQGVEVKRTVRDDVLKSLYGSKKAHLSQMIEVALAAVREQVAVSNLCFPSSGFCLGPWREASSNAERYGVFRQAIYRTSSLAALLDLESQDEDTSAQDGTTRHWFKQIQNSVVQSRPQLASAFNVEVQLIRDGLPPRLGFLFQRKGANFETLRPNALLGTVRAARGRLFELTRVKTMGDLDTGAMILGVPRPDDLTYPEKALQAIDRALLELRHEAGQDNIAVLAAHTVDDAAKHILTFAA